VSNIRVGDTMGCVIKSTMSKTAIAPRSVSRLNSRVMVVLYASFSSIPSLSEKNLAIAKISQKFYSTFILRSLEAILLTADLVVDDVQSLSKIPDFFKKSGICLCTSCSHKELLTVKNVLNCLGTAIFVGTPLLTVIGT
jgi:hypothetical protein